MPLVGLALTALAVAGLAIAVIRAARPAAFGRAGWAGLAVLGACGAGLVSPFDKPAVLVPAAWTGYLLAVDSAIHAVRGNSLLRTRPEVFVWLAVQSALLWLPFEWYNERLAGWYHAGLPAGPLRYALLGWSFACVWPALLETADLFMVLSSRGAGPRRSAVPISRRAAAGSGFAGAACLAVPLLVPRLDAGQHMLPLAAIGFLLLLDPLNCLHGRPSLWADWSRGGRARIAALAGAGLFCGLLADCLNYAADARWYSVWSLGAGWRLFELPLAAYAVLPLFALQAFVLQVFSGAALGMPLAEIPGGSAARGLELDHA